MKMLNKFVLSGAVIIFATVLVSWNHLNNSTKKLNNLSSLYLDEKNFQGLTDAETNALIAEDDGFKLPPEPSERIPTAEDVLIQKIPGDNNHLLIMAFYSRENYSGQFVNIENGGNLVFRDDGEGYDKKAGDGLYTAKVAADLNEFRQKALSMTAQMKKTNYKPIRFEHRAMIVDPDADESFDMQKWDRGEAVSISGLTNALGDLDLSDNALTSGVSANGISSGVSALVKSWLSKWTTSQRPNPNGDVLAARLAVNTKILNPWLSKSKNAGAPAGQLDMRFAPFKLLAIVNRFDLRDGGLHGIPGSAVGEGRYVFCLINSACNAALKMTVILEFGVNKPNTCDARKAWAQQWVNLKEIGRASCREGE